MVNLVDPSMTSAMAACCLRVLTTHPDAPVVTQTTMQAHLLHPLDVFTERLIQEICVLVACFAILDITLSVQHVSRDLELEWISDHSNDLIDLVRGKLACAFVHVNVTLFADDVGESTANALDGCERKHDLLTTIHVCVAYTQDMLEILALHGDRHGTYERL